MNRVVKRLAMAGLLAMFACSGGSTGSSLPPSLYGLTGSLQGIVADAVTGKRIGGDLKLYLIQGSTVRGPTRLITSSADPLQGEYAFSGVPVEFSGNNAIWKVVAIATGYQRFESEFQFNANINTNSSGAIIDTAYNKIGNIFMFPLGTNAPDYNFTVYYNGKPVPGATVELDPVTQSNDPKFLETTDTLTANTGYVPGIQSTPTDAAGKTTVTGANLVLGGAYKVSALPVVFTDTAGTKVQLALSCFGSGCPTLLVGIAGNPVNRIINMTDLNPTANPVYITSASNLAVGAVQANGQLVITFSAPVSLITPTSPPATSFGAVLTNGTLADGTAAAGAMAAPPVAATLSPDGLTLTLAPNYATAPNGVHGVVLTYNNGNATVSAKDYPALSFTVFGALRFADGTAASGVVRITGP